MTKRATVIIDIRDEDLVATAEAWLAENKPSLTAFVDKGCYCCVISWDVEGPATVIDSLPRELRSYSQWDDNDFAMDKLIPQNPIRRWLHRLRPARR
ncbi:hypothetical protein [Phreatobacter stygius]|uniref:Uncharacterized protein n=1 Tax=Phreatobacter stygius TaxID=1940610 RepID=A0A4D7B5D8_9HYPH|nr:hypothetical protein [Phreatobacter stygius]QCI63462.1 hypothetical protein E8M01_03935 [Phreatobacter stygius]